MPLTLNGLDTQNADRASDEDLHGSPPEEPMVQTAPFDPLRMNMLARSKIAKAAHLALFQLQDLSPEEQVAGASLLFAVFAARVGIPPDELHGMSMRVLREPDLFTLGNDLQVLRDYASIRVMGKDTTIM